MQDSTTTVESKSSSSAINNGNSSSNDSQAGSNEAQKRANQQAVIDDDNSKKDKTPIPLGVASDGTSMIEQWGRGMFRFFFSCVESSTHRRQQSSNFAKRIHYNWINFITFLFLC
jgi:hypothetical protein